VSGIWRYAISLMLTLVIADGRADTNDAQSGADGVMASGYAREMPPGASVGVAYLTLHNRTQLVQTLKAVELPLNPKASASLHVTVDEDGISRMRSLEEIALPAGGQLEMRPGATHLMLHGVKLKAGELLQLRLIFVDGKNRSLEIPVRGLMAAQQEDRGHHHHHHGG